MRISVNGVVREVPDGITVADLVRLLDKQPRYIAIERNRELVPRTMHAECMLEPDDDIEIVTLVGGG